MAATGYRVHPRFARAVRDLPDTVKKRLDRILDMLTRDPEAIRQDKGCKKVKSLSGQVFECRLGDNYRITFMLQPNREPYLLLVGDHDSIMTDTRRMFESGTIETSDLPAVGGGSGESKPQSQKYVPPSFRSTPKGPFSNLPEELLRYWKIPEDVIPVLKTLVDKEEALKLQGLSAEASYCLLAYVVDDKIIRPGDRQEETLSEVVRESVASNRMPVAAGLSKDSLGFTREQLLELEITEPVLSAMLSAKSWSDLDNVALPVKTTQRLQELVTAKQLTGLAPEHTRDLYADDSRVIVDYYTGNLKRLLLFLAPEQRPLVDLPLAGVQLVKGVAGSGKTTVALYRARRVVRENPDSKILFVTYNKSLARSAKELLDDILLPQEASRVETIHFHKWMHDFLSRECKPRVVNDDERQDLVEKAIATITSKGVKSKLLERPASWFSDEISQAIKGRGFKKYEEYASAGRFGRATALAEAGRKVVWEVFEAYQKLLSSKMDWDDYPVRCLEFFESKKIESVYDYVIIDEAQDLSPTALRLALSLCREKEPSSFVVADAAQSIYRRGFRWKEIGISLHGSRVHALNHTYRNTVEILKAANALLDGHQDLRDDGETSAVCTNTPRHGPKPTIAYLQNTQEETEFIADRILSIRQEKGVPWGSFALLTATNWHIKQLQNVLKKKGIPASVHSDNDFALGSDHAKLITLHSAKGLEFPIVFIFAVEKSVLPRRVKGGDEDALAEASDQARKLLYVGMTRAMQELIITTARDKVSPLLEDIQDGFVEKLKNL